MDNYIWWFVIIPIATLRLTRIIVTPEKIAEPLHTRVDRQLNKTLDPHPFYGWLSYLIQCYYCMSVWVGLACVVVWMVYPYILLPLVASAFTIILWDKL